MKLKNKEPKLFIHLGLPKTGTTFLQHHIFPQLPKEVLFLEKATNVSIWELLDSNAKKLLISSEHLLANPFKKYDIGWKSTFVNNFHRLHQLFPTARYILTLRKQEGLLASYYKEHISKGGRTNYPDIDAFFDIENNQGHIKMEDLYFTELIELIHSISGELPLIILQEEVKANPEVVFQHLCYFMELKEVTYQAVKKQVNIGVYKKQAAWLLRMNRLNQHLSKFGLDLYHPVLKKLGLTPDYIARKRMLMFGREPYRLPDEMVAFMSNHYQEDWQRMLFYKAQKDQSLD